MESRSCVLIEGNQMSGMSSCSVRNDVGEMQRRYDLVNCLLYPYYGRPP